MRVLCFFLTFCYFDLDVLLVLVTMTITWKYDGHSIFSLKLISLTLIFSFYWYFGNFPVRSPSAIEIWWWNFRKFPKRSPPLSLNLIQYRIIQFKLTGEHLGFFLTFVTRHRFPWLMVMHGKKKKHLVFMQYSICLLWISSTLQISLFLKSKSWKFAFPCLLLCFLIYRLVLTGFYVCID